MAEIIVSEAQFARLKGRIDSNLIKEDQWYNTVMDLLGVIDPTPVIDIINALSYWKQGDTFYAVMSFLSAIPYGGDFVAKPAMFAAKSSGKSAKILKEAMSLMDTNPAKANKLFAQLADGNDEIAKMIKTSPNWGADLTDKLVILPKEMSGISEYLTKVLSFFQRNSLGMKWAYGLTPGTKKTDDGDETTTDTSDISYSGEATSDDAVDSDPLNNLFGDLFSGNLNFK